MVLPESSQACGIQMYIITDSRENCRGPKGSKHMKFKVPSNYMYSKEQRLRMLTVVQRQRKSC